MIPTPSVASCDRGWGRGGNAPQEGASMKRRPARVSVTHPDRPPDCVTVTRIGDTILTVNGYCDPEARETAEDKLLKVIQRDLGLDAQPIRGRTPFTNSG